MDLNYLQEQMNHIEAGDHMVFLYDDKDINVNADILSSFITSRIHKNEKCLYICGGPELDLMLKKLRLSIDLDKSINSGQLSIVNKEEAYSKDGKFVPEKMIALLKTLTQEAIREGYSAFAITGEISWVLEYEDGFERIMHYEYLLNTEIFGAYPVSAICRYNINKFSSNMIKNIIEVHPIVIWDKQVHENPFYLDLVSTKDIDIEKYQVDEMLKAIREFTHVKSRFRDEIEIQKGKYQELQLNVLKDMIVSLTGLLGIHDEYTKNHSQNVANIAKKIAEEMNFSKKRIIQIYYAGLVHDIGKALIPREIINKNGKLTAAEYEVIKKHPENAYKALVNAEALNFIAHIVLEHHERWDGKGYPSAIKGEDIYLESRILALADSYDAMTSERPYRKAFSKEEAISEIKKNAGTQFDPDITRFAIENIFNYL
jgi:HD-GYP domain-containing protein (c-di-GMP phosphodiesterase class II)